MFYNNCLFNPFAHRVVSDGTTVGTTVALAVTNSTNIADHEPFKFYANSRAIDLSTVAAAPVPVTIGINGTQIELWNKFGEQILSNEIPREAKGFVSLESPTPHVILIDTPKFVILS